MYVFLKPVHVSVPSPWDIILQASQNHLIHVIYHSEISDPPNGLLYIIFALEINSQHVGVSVF